MAVLLLLGFLGGCSGLVSGTKSAIQAAFQLGVSSLNFGKVTVGKQSTQTVSVVNTGNTSITITQATFSNPQFSLAGSALPMSLATGQSGNLTVAITPGASGTVTGTMTVQGSDGTTPETASLSATAAVAGPQISLSNTAVEFGSVGVGATGTASVTISNAGSSDLNISLIALSGAEFGETGIATPKTISAGGSATMSLTFHPTAAGTATGSLTITSNDPVNPTTVISLDGSGASTNQGQLQANPAAVSFGNVSVSGTATQQVTLTNTGATAVQISTMAVSGSGVSISGINFPLNLAPSATTTFNAVFAPAATGNVTGSLSVVSNGTGSPLNIPVSGAGVQGGLKVSSSSFSFGSVVDGQTKSQTFTLTNTGNASVTISQLSASGTGYSVSGLTTPATLAAGATTSFSAVFAPATAGNLSGTISISSDAPNSPTTISLTGTGVASSITISANPTSLSFGNVNTGTSASQQVTITNTGNSSAQISQISVNGTGFSVTGASTPATLGASQTLTFNVVFDPTTAGSASGSVAVTSNAAGSPLNIPVTGTGTQGGLAISPSSFGFGSVVDGQIKSQTFTLNNKGNASLTISQLSVSGAGYSVSGLTTPLTLAAGASTSFSAVFAPTTAGSLSGTISISSNGPNSPASIALSGTGVASSVTLSANPTSVSFGGVNAGSSKSSTVTLTNSGNTSLTISQLSISAKDVTETGVTAPLTLAAGQSQTMSVTFSPASAESVSGNITITSAQGTSTVVSVSGTGLQAGISLTPSSASLGNVVVGSSNSQTIQIGNPGNAALTITQASVTGAGFSANGLSLPLSINPGQTTTFNAEFQPSSAGGASGSISLVSNAAGSPSVINLTGTGVAATETISFSATNISFGNVNTGTSASQGVTITNTGNSSVQISQIAVSGTGYSLTGANTPVTLSASQTLTFNVVFDPTTAGSASGSVSVTSNAAGSPATIALSGTGVQVVSHSVALSWTASTSTVSGYNIYRSTTSGSGYSKLNSSLVAGVSYTDSGVQNGSTYYYVTTAVDSSGDESTYSNEASAVIP